MRLLVLSVCLALGACAARTTPAARSCTVLNDESQLASCVGKQVILRGRVTATTPPRISGVAVEAGPELVDRHAHAMGTLERDATGFVLKAGGTLATAHATKDAR